jgi:ubiquinone/menaquinone biosynthesis C-methylase UbiE
MLQALPFIDNFFDFIHMSFVLMFMSESEWHVALRELVRVLKPGGIIELHEANSEYVPAGPHTVRWNEIRMYLDIQASESPY